MPGLSGNHNWQGNSKPLRLLQFTDTHLFGTPDGRLMGVDTAYTFSQVLDAALKQWQEPDFYLLTGDISQDETLQSYARFAQASRHMQAPAYFLPGNHDSRHLMLQAFAADGLPFRSERRFSRGGWQIILLDTQVPGEVHGELSAQELQFLQDALADEPDRHTLVCMHHHPLPVGSAWMDSIKVRNSDQFLEIIDKNRHVRGVLCGHIHQEFQTTRRSVLYLGTPSTCVQFKPQSQGFALDAVPPGYRFMQLNPDGSIHTEVGRVEAVAAGLDMASLGY